MSSVRTVPRKAMRSKNLLQSFAFAFNGVWHALRTQRNLRIHLSAGLLALVLGIVAQLSLLEFAVLGLVVTMVVVAELLNTALESLSDAVTEEYHPHVMIAKDVAAAAVLVAAIGAVVVGVLLFLPHILLSLSR